MRFTAFSIAMLCAAAAPHAAPPVQDTMAQRMQACVVCHGKEGRATNAGYFPRIAGKPAGYLVNQLQNFKSGRRRNEAMNHLVQHLSDDYLRDIAAYFAGLDLPYPPAQPQALTPEMQRAAEQLVLRGDARRNLPACVSCHGPQMAGMQPAMPGLLTLPGSYLSAQLGAWRTGQRKAMAPDCMADVAKRLTVEEVGLVARWLSAQTLPTGTKPAPASAQPLPMRCGSGEATPPAASTAAAAAGEKPEPGPAERGAYLARAGNCAGCHTVAGGETFAGGRGIETPFGTVFAPNITPDPETGIGRWSAADFWRALHEGRSKDGHALYPAFPYPSFTYVTREDSDALYAYLLGVKPVRQANQPHALRFPYNLRAALWAWRWLFFKPGQFSAQPQRGAEWNRGKYLVQGLGHCAACHSTRNALGAVNAEFAGGLMPDRSWYAPSLADPREAGVQEWPPAEVARLLRTGVSAGASVSGPMAEVVYGSTQHLSEQDAGAMAVFLASLPRQAQPAGKSLPAATDAMARGQKLYEQHCAACHGDDGKGVPAIYPALAGNRAVTLGLSNNLVQVIRQGGFAPGTAGNPRPFGMPPFGQVLGNDEIADVATYVRGSWGNAAGAVSPLDVHRMR